MSLKITFAHILFIYILSAWIHKEIDFNWFSQVCQHGGSLIKDIEWICSP